MASDQKSAFYERLQLAVSQNQSLDFMPEWLCENTMHPTKPAKHWSFEEHEFQIDIVKSTSHRQSIKKCSQVGLSEVSARKALALATLRQGVQLIYTLPTGSFAQMFAKTRVDPIIENSPPMDAIVDDDTNNTKLKRIGNSFMHFVGTYSESSPISIPASYIVSDEVDFSNQSVLTEFNSRLGHQKEDESANIKFSTPTVDGYGISAAFDQSSQGRYGVKCEHCEQWQIPEFLEDTILPHSKIAVPELTRHDVAAMSKEEIDAAFLACPSCRKDLTSSLLNKDRRGWIHKYPERQQYHEGFHVMPYDVPTVNPVSRTIHQMLDYKRIASWYNFKLGLTYADDTTKFNIETIKNNTQVMSKEGVFGAVIGVDVGKISWLSVGIPFINRTTHDVEQLNVIDLERIDSNTLGTKTLAEKIIEIANKYGARVIVVDAAPDFTTAQQVHRTYMIGRAYGNYYVNDKAFAKEMANFKVNDNKGVCLASRTASLDELCELNNKGHVKYPEGNDNMADLRNHFDALKRVEGQEGEEAVWVKKEKADDHWAHSINYLNIAAGISAESGDFTAFNLVPTLSTVKVKTVRGYQL